MNDVLLALAMFGATIAAIALGRCRTRCAHCGRCVDGRNVSIDRYRPLCMRCRRLGA